MTLEQEVKLAVNGGEVLDLSSLAWLSPYIQSKRSFHLISHYFDTPELLLLQQGVGLRRRFDGKQWFQTVKESGHAQQGLHQRREWECRLDNDAFDLKHLHQTPLTTLFEDENKWQQITVIFTTDFQREVMLLAIEGGLEIELAYDRGVVYTDDSQSPIHEVELELNSGSVEQLQTVAIQLQQTMPVEPSDISKAQRGYQLLKEVSSAGK